MSFYFSLSSMSSCSYFFCPLFFFFFFQAEDGIRDIGVTGVQTCALPILMICDRIFYPLPRSKKAEGKLRMKILSQIISNPTGLAPWGPLDSGCYYLGNRIPDRKSVV